MQAAERGAEREFIREYGLIVEQLAVSALDAFAGAETARLREAQHQVEKALALLRSLAAVEQSPELSQRLNPQYRELKERGLELLKSLQYLRLAWEGFECSAEQM